MLPFFSPSSFQGCTTASPAPRREPVSSPPPDTSSSAPASSTRCASRAATRRCATVRGRRNGRSHRPAPARLGRRRCCSLPSALSACGPPPCADGPPSTRRLLVFGELEISRMNPQSGPASRSLGKLCRAEQARKGLIFMCVTLRRLEVMWRTA